jgi:hypothetical protein
MAALAVRPDPLLPESFAGSSETTMDTTSRTRRTCLREPISAIADAARLLDAAVSAHLLGQRAIAQELIRLADIPAVKAWGESLWGKSSPYNQLQASAARPPLPADQRQDGRMPSLDVRRYLLHRDGYHCRFCGIPVIRKEIRERIRKAYPELAIWGTTNVQQHGAFQTMWVQYDHVVPHAHGGGNELDNLVITCAPCNYGRMQYTLEEMELADPRLREPVRSLWDGLERFH